MERRKIIYDEEEDIFFISKQKKVRSSIDTGDFIFDIGFDGSITGIEILDASKNLNIPEKKLAKVTKAALRILYHQKTVHFVLMLCIDNKEHDISIPFPVELGHRKTQVFQVAVA